MTIRPEDWEILGLEPGADIGQVRRDDVVVVEQQLGHVGDPHHRRPERVVGVQLVDEEAEQIVDHFPGAGRAGAALSPAHSALSGRALGR